MSKIQILLNKLSWGKYYSHSTLRKQICMRTLSCEHAVARFLNFLPLLWGNLLSISSLFVKCPDHKYAFIWANYSLVGRMCFACTYSRYSRQFILYVMTLSINVILRSRWSRLSRLQKMHTKCKRDTKYVACLALQNLSCGHNILCRHTSALSEWWTIALESIECI